jgi:hypothetical protein
MAVHAAEKLGIEYKCQNCGKRRPSTQHRTVYLKNYVGPCGDSFCFASCDMSTCHPKALTICDECKTRLAKPGT